MSSTDAATESGIAIEVSLRVSRANAPSVDDADNIRAVALSLSRLEVLKGSEGGDCGTPSRLTS